MKSETLPVAPEDAVWAAFNTNMTVEALIRFCQEDVERLFRINPYLEFSKFEQTAERQFHMVGKNSSQAQAFEFDEVFEVEPLADGVRLHYRDSLKQTTTFLVEPAEQGSKLTITDDYHGRSESERQARLAEVDQSIVTWAEYLQRFILTWKQWSWLAPWRWYMQVVWKRLKPTGRRIAYMLIWITVFEIALIMLGVAIYFVEYA